MTVATMFLASCAPTVYDNPYPVEAVELPRDDAAHRAPIEWWYYTGHFEDEEGHEYGFELTFFKAYAPPDVRVFGFLPAYLIAEKGHVAHFAITDVDGQTFDMAERADFWTYEASASEDALDVQVADWYARRVGERTHEIYASLGGKRLRLTLTETKPAALHGDPPGIQSMGPGGVSYYVSYTRMAAEGTLFKDCTFLGCEAAPVTGQGWHDHQWGDFDISSYAGWDWFSLQFDDNTELMLYLIRQPSGEYTARAGTFIEANGRTVELGAEDFTLEETGETWQSEATDAIYPVQWKITVPAHGIETTVTPVLLEQEMDTRASTGIVYWEGAVRATGASEGVGYVELTNYDLYPYGQTSPDTPLQPLRGPFGGG